MEEIKKLKELIQKEKDLSKIYESKISRGAAKSKQMKEQFNKLRDQSIENNARKTAEIKELYEKYKEELKEYKYINFDKKQNEKYELFEYLDEYKENIKDGLYLDLVNGLMNLKNEYDENVWEDILKYFQ